MTTRNAIAITLLSPLLSLCAGACANVVGPSPGPTPERCAPISIDDVSQQSEALAPPPSDFDLRLLEPPGEFFNCDPDRFAVNCSDTVDSCSVVMPSAAVGESSLAILALQPQEGVPLDLATLFLQADSCKAFSMTSVPELVPGESLTVGTSSDVRIYVEFSPTPQTPVNCSATLEYGVNRVDPSTTHFVGFADE